PHDPRRVLPIAERHRRRGLVGSHLVPAPRDARHHGHRHGVPAHAALPPDDGHPREARLRPHGCRDPGAARRPRARGGRRPALTGADGPAFCRPAGNPFRAGSMPLVDSSAPAAPFPARFGRQHAEKPGSAYPASNLLCPSYEWKGAVDMATVFQEVEMSELEKDILLSVYSGRVATDLVQLTLTEKPGSAGEARHALAGLVMRNLLAWAGENTYLLTEEGESTASLLSTHVLA